MQVYNEGEFNMIPLAMNAFYYNIPLGTKKIMYANNVSISEEFLDVLLEYIEKLPEGRYIIIDMESVDYAFRLFEKFQKINRPLIFININSQILRDKMKENLPSMQFSKDERQAVLNIRYESSIEKLCLKYKSVIAGKVYVNIVKDLIDGMNTPQKLDSSGLYSNMYVNVKRLFLHPEKYYAIIFGLAKRIVESEIEYDGFVSSSKNGALLANMLGMMLDKKVIHILGLGPKYSMNVGNLQKEIKKKKNYIYVFDFRCTGTEMKILSALINANDAYIHGAVGIAVYKTELIENNLIYLVDVKKEGIPYKIAGEEEDIVKLTKKE